MDETISSVVSISPAFATEVHLKRDFTNLQENREKLHGYVPTSLSRKALQGILEGLHPASRKRVHLITGSYGTGKSHFGLVLANIVSRNLEDPDLIPFFEKLGDRDPSGLQYVQTARKPTKPYLVILPEPHWDPEGFHHSLTIALSEALEREKIQFRPPSHFDAALDCIQNWEQNMEEAYKKLKAAFTRREKTVEMVLDGLEDYNDSMYALFEDAYAEVAYGAMFHPQATAKPTSVYEETAKYLKSTGNWQAIFPGVAALKLDTTGYGLSFSVRFTKQDESLPVRFVHDADSTKDITLIREVNMMDRYSMGLFDLAARAGIGRNKCLALVHYMGLQADPECFKEFCHKSIRYKGYSPKALQRIQEALPTLDLDQIWRNYSNARQKRSGV